MNSTPQPIKRDLKKQNSGNFPPRNFGPPGTPPGCAPPIRNYPEELESLEKCSLLELLAKLPCVPSMPPTVRKRLSKNVVDRLGMAPTLPPSRGKGLSTSGPGLGDFHHHQPSSPSPLGSREMSSSTSSIQSITLAQLESIPHPPALNSTVTPTSARHPNTPPIHRPTRPASSASPSPLSSAAASSSSSSNISNHSPQPSHKHTSPLFSSPSLSVSSASTYPVVSSASIPSPSSITSLSSTAPIASSQNTEDNDFSLDPNLVFQACRGGIGSELEAEMLKHLASVPKNHAEQLLSNAFSNLHLQRTVPDSNTSMDKTKGDKRFFGRRKQADNECCPISINKIVSVIMAATAGTFTDTLLVTSTVKLKYSVTVFPPTNSNYSITCTPTSGVLKKKAPCTLTVKVAKIDHKPVKDVIAIDVADVGRFYVIIRTK